MVLLNDFWHDFKRSLDVGHRSLGEVRTLKNFLLPSQGRI